MMGRYSSSVLPSLATLVAIWPNIVRILGPIPCCRSVFCEAPSICRKPVLASIAVFSGLTASFLFPKIAATNGTLRKIVPSLASAVSMNELRFSSAIAASTSKRSFDGRSMIASTASWGTIDLQLARVRNTCFAAGDRPAKVRSNKASRTSLRPEMIRSTF